MHQQMNQVHYNPNLNFLGPVMSGRRKYNAAHEDIVSDMQSFKEELRAEHDLLRKKLSSVEDAVVNGNLYGAGNANNTFLNQPRVPMMSISEDGRQVFQRAHANAAGMDDDGDLFEAYKQQEKDRNRRRQLAMNTLAGKQIGVSADMYMKMEMDRKENDRGRPAASWDGLDALDHLTQGLSGVNSRQGTQTITTMPLGHGGGFGGMSGVAGLGRSVDGNLSHSHGPNFLSIGGGGGTLPQESKLYALDGGVIFDGETPRPTTTGLRQLNLQFNDKSFDMQSARESHAQVNGDDRREGQHAEMKGSSRFITGEQDESTFSIDKINEQAKSKLDALTELEKKTKDSRKEVQELAKQKQDVQTQQMMRALNASSFNMTGQIDNDDDEDTDVLLKFLAPK